MKERTIQKILLENHKRENQEECETCIVSENKSDIKASAGFIQLKCVYINSRSFLNRAV